MLFPVASYIIIFYVLKTTTSNKVYNFLIYNSSIKKTFHYPIQESFGSHVISNFCPIYAKKYISE